MDESIRNLQKTILEASVQLDALVTERDASVSEYEKAVNFMLNSSDI